MEERAVNLPLNAPEEAYSEAELANRHAVLAFYDALDWRDLAVVRQFLSPDFVQHGARIADGPDGMAEYFETMWRDHPNFDLTVKRAFVDGDMVTLHVHATDTPSGSTHGDSIMEIYRLQDGKIAERWEVMRSIPDESANRNGMFYD